MDTTQVITIRRPLAEVYAFYRDFSNLPKFLGDVMAVETIDSKTYRWTIEGPFGIKVKWTVRITEERPNALLRYEAGVTGVSAQWTIAFRATSATDTEVTSTIATPLGRLGIAAMALIGKFPASEQTSNLNRLKQLLETGRVTDTSYAVPGKFG